MTLFSTIFLSLQNFDSSESKLRREFESYGPIKMVSEQVSRFMGVRKTIEAGLSPYLALARGFAVNLQLGRLEFESPKEVCV